MLTLIAIVQAATEALPAHEATGGIAAIGLNGKALLFQILNFVILLAALRLFAYPPILKILRARQEKIAESMRTADQVQATKAAAAVEKQQVLAEARAQAQQIAGQARMQAEEIVREAEAQAKTKAAQAFTQSQAQLAQEVERARTLLKSEVLNLVAAATEKIIDVKLDPKQDAALIENAIAAAMAKDKTH